MDDANIRRFYALLGKLHLDDAAEMKNTMVLDISRGRTTHLHDLSAEEMTLLLLSLERTVDDVRSSQLKKARSLCLHLMQKLGIDTTDWNRVNAFCRDVRIAGKAFYPLTLPELEALARKLRVMGRKGGLRPSTKQKGTEADTPTLMTLRLDGADGAQC